MSLYVGPNVLISFYHVHRDSATHFYSIVRWLLVIKYKQKEEILYTKWNSRWLEQQSRSSPRRNVRPVCST